MEEQSSEVEGHGAGGAGMRTLKQRFCKHHYVVIAENQVVNEFLYQCKKCKLYAVSHMGVGIEYKTDKFPTNNGWEHVRREVQE